MSLYYLVANINGFEEPIRVGTEKELLAEREKLERGRLPSLRREEERVWEKVSYYLVRKREWDAEHCPLIPVDLS
jgi:hypothetical protein